MITYIEHEPWHLDDTIFWKEILERLQKKRQRLWTADKQEG